MELTELPLPREIWAATPCAAQALILTQRERLRDLEARLSRHSRNSSRPPSSDPPQAPACPKAPASGRKRGGQPGQIDVQAPRIKRAKGPWRKEHHVNERNHQGSHARARRTRRSEDA